MKKLIILSCLLTFVRGMCQVQDLKEAQDLLHGGWEFVHKKQPSAGRLQFYFCYGDTVDWRSVLPHAHKGCKPQDTVIVDRWWWKAVDFNKNKQIIKVLLTPIRRTIRFSCDQGPSPESPIFIYFKIVSKDELIWREDNKRFERHVVRKKDQVNYSPW